MYGVELIHPRREGRSPQQIGRKELSNPRWIVGGKRCLVLNQWGLVAAWAGATANVADNRESIQMLGIIGALQEHGLHHSLTAYTRRSPAMRVKPAMEGEGMPDAASSPGSPCSLSGVPNTRNQ